MKLSLLFFAFACISFISFSQENPLHRQQGFNLDKGIALSGYDPVSYFIQKKPLKGKTSLRSSYQGIEYFFSTADNLARFKQNPSQFEPQYGGWCAYAMGATGEKVEIDPETYKIIDGKLYLYYHSFLNNTLDKWNKEEKILKAKADSNWKKIF